MPEGLGEKISPMNWALRKRAKLERKLKDALEVGNIIRLGAKGSVAGLTALGLKKGAEAAYDTAVAIQEPTTPPPTPAQRFADMHAADPRTTRGKLG